MVPGHICDLGSSKASSQPISDSIVAELVSCYLIWITILISNSIPHTNILKSGSNSVACSHKTQPCIIWLFSAKKVALTISKQCALFLSGIYSCSCQAASFCSLISLIFTISNKFQIESSSEYSSAFFGAKRAPGCWTVRSQQLRR